MSQRSVVQAALRIGYGPARRSIEASTLGVGMRSGFLRFRGVAGWVSLLASVVLCVEMMLAGSVAAASVTAGSDVKLGPGTYQFGPSVAYDGSSHHLAVWSQNPNPTVVGALVGADGTVGSEIAIGGGITGDGAASVAWNGSRYLVVWVHQFSTPAGQSDVRARFVTATGAVSGPIFTVSSPGLNETSASVVAGGSTFLVTWADSRTGTQNVWGTRVANDGTILDLDGIAISADTVRDDEPQAAWNGSEFLVVWQYDYSSTDEDIYARIVSANGVPGTTTVVIGNTLDQRSPAVSSDGTSFLVVWTEGPDFDARGALVGTDAHAGSSFTISAAAGTQFAPQVAWNGSYLVVWDDSRNGRVMYGDRVSVAGAVLDGDGFAITGSAEAFSSTITRGKGSGWVAGFYRGRLSDSNVNLRFVNPK